MTSGGVGVTGTPQGQVGGQIRASGLAAESLQQANTMTCRTSAAKTGREMIWKPVLFLKLLFFNRENLSGPFLIHNKEQVGKKERANEDSESC